jgi:RNA-directed DNA polymerase
VSTGRERGGRNSGIPIPISLAAWLKACRGKRPSANQLAFDARWLDRLLALKTAQRVGDWQPARTVSFVVNHPKTREIHAPDFADRVVHHILVERLAALYAPIFIHDCYANRAGKGTHAAVERLQSFIRQRNGRGWFLKLDIHNYFNSIHRSILYGLLKTRITKARHLPADHALAQQSLCHKLLQQKTVERVSDPDAAARIPPHKRLANAAPGCGLPVGNLSSQFFANIYLYELDQFVKHQHKCHHYLRYVDDFVLLAESRQQLQSWQVQIEAFLTETLRLKLKDDACLAPLSQGIDFLGYQVFATHRLVRPRVLRHCRDKIEAWARRHVHASTAGLRIRADSPALEALQAMLGSYWGHFKHANSARLRRALFTRYTWLALLFELDAPAGQVGARPAGIVSPPGGRGTGTDLADVHEVTFMGSIVGLPVDSSRRGTPCELHDHPARSLILSAPLAGEGGKSALSQIQISPARPPPPHCSHATLGVAGRDLCAPGRGVCLGMAGGMATAAKRQSLGDPAGCSRIQPGARAEASAVTQRARGRRPASRLALPWLCLPACRSNRLAQARYAATRDRQMVSANECNDIFDYERKKSMKSTHLLLAALLLTQPLAVAAPFSLNGDEVTDAASGLVWRRCAEGMGWNGITCTGSALSFNHEDALRRAKTEAATSGKAWRLPNVKELASLVDRRRSEPAIDSTAFPETPSGSFWSSSPYAGNADYAWDVYFSSGSVGNGSRDSNNAVRLVRASQ